MNNPVSTMRGLFHIFCEQYHFFFAYMNLCGEWVYGVPAMLLQVFIAIVT